MKATLTFSLPDEQNEYKMVTHASDMYCSLWEIGQEIFRPARKHGYNDQAIMDCLAKCNDQGEELIGLLEGKFYAILAEHGVNLDELGN